MSRATSHPRSPGVFVVLAVVVHCISAPTLLAQPGPEMPHGQLSLPPLPDGSHDFDFLAGVWQLRQGRLAHPLSGPNASRQESYGRLVARTPATGSVTVEWEARLMDSTQTRASGFARMTYDPKSRQWTIRESDSPTATPEPPVVGHFDNGAGSFVGLREYEGRTVLVRLSWRVGGLGHAEFRRAFSTDGGVTWETHWIMHLSREPSARRQRPPSQTTCCGNVELTWYTAPPKAHEELIRLFARESFAMGDTFPQDIALLRGLTHPNTFVLVRGFGWNGRIGEFYDGLPWGAHRATLERAQIRADSVYELRSDLLTWGFTLGDRKEQTAARDPGIVVATVYTYNWRRVDSYKLGLFFSQAVIPRTIGLGARLLGVFTTTSFGIAELWTGQRAVSAIPGRPLPAQRSALVSFAWFADTAAYERYRQTLEADPYWRDTVAPQLARFVTSISTSAPLVPVGRSRELLELFEP